MNIKSLSIIFSFSFLALLPGALTETATFPAKPGTKPLPVQNEPVHPSFKESPYKEAGKVPEFTAAEKRSGMMIFRT